MGYIWSAIKAFTVAILALAICLLPSMVAFAITSSAVISVVFLIIGIILMFAFVFWWTDNVDI